MPELKPDAMIVPDPTERRCCELENRAFKVLGEPLFIRSEDGATVMMRVQLGDTQAMVPLAAIQHEAGIANDTADGRMIKLITQSLAFVQFLHLGDELPPEVLTGGASWTAGKESTIWRWQGFNTGFCGIWHLPRTTLPTSTGRR